MTRPLELVRDEAEMLVDLCENTSDKRLWELAINLRAQWGMRPQTMKDGRPEAYSLKRLGISDECVPS